MTLAENDTVATIGAGGKRVWLYPQIVRGRFIKARTIVAWLLIGVLMGAPWVDVGGHPAMLFDIPGRRFYFFGLTLFATDSSYLLFVFGFLVFGIFLFTAVLGRAWCGWMCPQTVFLESLFRPLEQLLEGKPAARKQLDHGPWSLRRVYKKVVKLTAFAVVSGMIATTVVAYFLGRDGVLQAQFDPLSHPVGTMFFLGTTGLLFFDFAYFREQTCIVVCPYGRFQSVLMDTHSLTIGYDVARGEPRGKVGTTGAGACVDCDKCVAVCPTGIDIRRGTQMECVACMACIDACDDIMDRIGRPRGLIRFTSEEALQGRRRRFMRPRVLIYVGILALITVVLAVSLSRREDLEVWMTREGAAPFAVLPDGRVQNTMSLRVSNKTDETRTVRVRIAEPRDASFILPGEALTVAGNGIERVPLLLFRTAVDGARESHVMVEIVDDLGVVRPLRVPFLSPGSEP